MFEQPFVYPLAWGLKNPKKCCLIKFKTILLYTIWCEMTDDQEKLLAVFEVRVRDLMALCDKQNQKIKELTDAFDQKEATLKQAMETIAELNAKYDKLLTARALSVNNEEMKNAKMRLSKLVREVDKCIALLNE